MHVTNLVFGEIANEPTVVRNFDGQAIRFETRQCGADRGVTDGEDAGDGVKAQGRAEFHLAADDAADQGIVDPRAQLSDLTEGLESGTCFGKLIGHGSVLGTPKESLVNVHSTS